MMNDKQLHRFVDQATADASRAMVSIVQAAEHHFDDRVAGRAAFLHEGFTPEELKALLHERAEFNRYKPLILAAPRLLFALEQAQAALPDAWAAAKCNVDPDLIRLIDMVKAEAKEALPNGVAGTAAATAV